MLAVAAGVLVLTACGDSCASSAEGEGAPAVPTSSAAVSAAHNNADVAFVQGTIPHHSQAVTMAAQGSGQAGSE